jgi:hypothetical protein
LLTYGVIPSPHHMIVHPNFAPFPSILSLSFLSSFNTKKASHGSSYPNRPLSKSR